MASSSSSSPEISAAPPAAGSQSTVQYAHLSREEVLEELSSRFILNLPEEELASLERVCFQVEQAHWYYEDFIREQNPAKFPSYTLKTFSEALFRACPPLHHWAHDHERAFESFMKYKTRVPVCGAIMLNDTWEKCVLVKGWKSSAGWGFPKGKINEQEPRPRCAAREVLEETGYDLDGQIIPEDVIELSIKEQSISLYIVPGVPEDYPFKTRTRKEISKISWFKLSDLPTWKRSKAVPGKFYLISPFIGPLKAFINSRKPRNLARRARRSDNVQVLQEAQVSSEEDSGILDSCPAIPNDVNAQESGSQSSSADNGEPHTPSPHYSAPPLNYQTQVIQSADQTASNMLDLNGVDPHFARLLNSLQLSASVPMSDEKQQGLTAQQTSPMSSSSTAADFINTDSSREVLNHPESGDWSLNVPSPVPNVSSSSLAQHGMAYAPRPIRSAATTPVHPAVDHTLSLPSNRPTETLYSHDNHLRMPSPSHAAPTSAPASDVSSLKQSPHMSRARHGPRASTDISPYLSRAHDIPKEMRYISMLESVVKESDRISQLQHRASPLPQSSQAQMEDRSFRPPGPSTSVPPGSIYGRMESPVIYSSGPAATTALSSTVLPPLRQMPLPQSLPFDDPFTVRPRTSVPFHPVPYPLPPRQPTLAENMRYMTPGPDLHGPVRANDMSNFPSQMARPPFGHPLPMLTGQRGGLPLRVVPPQFPALRYGDQPPLSAPAISPSSTFMASVNASRPANNAHLLSILNTPSTARRAVPLQADLMNGMGPR